MTRRFVYRVHMGEFGKITSIFAGSMPAESYKEVELFLQQAMNKKPPNLDRETAFMETRIDEVEM